MIKYNCSKSNCFNYLVFGKIRNTSSDVHLRGALLRSVLKVFVYAGAARILGEQAGGPDTRSSDE